MRQRGYFKAKCSYETDFSKKNRSRTTYTVDVGPRYFIKSLAYATADSLVKPYLSKLQSESYLAVGKPVDSGLFNGEKIRITDTLKNNGFAFFAPANVDFVGDSTEFGVHVRVDILPPTDSTYHQRIRVGSVYVSNQSSNATFSQPDTIVQGIKFMNANRRFLIRPGVVADAVLIKPGLTYRQSDLDQTYRNLSNLGVYRLISIKPNRDTLQRNEIDMLVSLSPNKRVTFGAEFGTNYLANAQIARLLGLAVGTSFRNRNAFGGAENLQITARGGSDLNFQDLTNPFFTVEGRLGASLTIPRFLDYFGIWGAVHNWRFGDRHALDKLYKRMQKDGKAQFNLGVNYLSFVNQFVNQSANFSFGYILPGNKNRLECRWSHVGIDLLQVRTEVAFQAILDRNPFLKNSLGDQLFTGFFLRDFLLRYQTNNPVTSPNWKLTSGVEFSGVEVHLANLLWNLPYPGTKFSVGSLNFAKYVRFEADWAHQMPFNTTNGLKLVTHAGGGIATPYGGDQTVPYVKQFFIGGPNGLRAWPSRKLGPGAFRDYNARVGSQFYQSADIRLEANTELQFNLIPYFKGALFIDAGNIWTLKKDNREGHITSQFYNQVAIGTGAGLRFDFDYAVIRVDFGLPVRNPYPDENGSHSALKSISRRDFNLNLAMGYPFF